MAPEQAYLAATIKFIEDMPLRDDQCDLQVKAIDILTELKMSFEDEWGQPVCGQSLMGDLG